MHGAQAVEPDDGINRLSYRVIGAAIAVHQALGPGLDERAYESALAVEFTARGLPFEQQVSVSIAYRGVIVGRGRIDFVVGDRLIVELKAARKLTPIHVSQVLGYLRALNEPLGLLLNFEVSALKDGIRRVVAQPRH